MELKTQSLDFAQRGSKSAPHRGIEWLTAGLQDVMDDRGRSRARVPCAFALESLFFFSALVAFSLKAFLLFARHAAALNDATRNSGPPCPRRLSQSSLFIRCAQ
jgi:hypothetical protein